MGLDMEAGDKPVGSMRRIFALMLIATSGWLFYRTANEWLGGVDHLLSPKAIALLDDPDFMFPIVGSGLGLLGGLTVFFGGPGGAIIALLGGIAVAGFALNIDQTMELSHFWDNPLAVGVVMAMLAALTASMSRAPPRSALSLEDDRRPYSSGRRVF